MSVTYVDDLNLSGVKDLRKRLTQVKNSHIKYGWLSNKQHKIKGMTKGVPTAQIAFWNEFGTKNIPARPYLTITSLVSQQSAVPFIQKYFLDNLLGSDYTSTPLDTIASHITKEFKLVKGTGKPLAPATVKKKGFSTHWVETGVLMDEWQATTYQTALRDN